MNTIAYLFSLFISIGLPILISIILVFKSRSFFKPIFLGVLTFLVFQVFTRVYLIQEVLPTQVWYIVFTYQYPLLYVFLLSLTAGLFEECGRAIMMKYFMKKANINQAIAFGIGHGGIEAILFVGIALIMTNPIFIDTQSLFMSGLERLSAMVLHIGFSVLVYQAIYQKKRYYVLFAIGVHTLVNFVSVTLMMNGVNLWIVEAVLGLMALIALVIIIVKWRNENETPNSNR
jgi:uncharacterized membrane protein YhfC